MLMSYTLEGDNSGKVARVPTSEVFLFVFIQKEVHLAGGLDTIKSLSTQFTNRHNRHCLLQICLCFADKTVIPSNSLCDEFICQGFFLHIKLIWDKHCTHTLFPGFQQPTIRPTSLMSSKPIKMLTMCRLWAGLCFHWVHRVFLWNYFRHWNCSIWISS